MEDFHLMQLDQSFGDLDKDIPDVLFIELSTLFLVLKYFLEQVASISVFHHNTKWIKNIFTRETWN